MAARSFRTIVSRAAMSGLALNPTRSALSEKERTAPAPQVFKVVALASDGEATKTQALLDALKLHRCRPTESVMLTAGLGRRKRRRECPHWFQR